MKVQNIVRFLIDPEATPGPVYIDITKSHHQLPENIARETVLRAVLVGSTIIFGLLCLLLLLSYFVAGNHHIAYRVYAGFIALAYLLVAGAIARQRRYNLSALLLVVFYMTISSLAIWQWGVHIAFAILLMSVNITLAGILLGARFALYTAAAQSSILLFVQLLVTTKIHGADVSWQRGLQSKFGEMLGYCLLFGVLALVSWLFGRQTERALFKARKAETDLLRQKKLLSKRLRERTQKLRVTQIQEMQQLYRFAELGQLSTALLHDLANHLTVLTLDIKDLERPGRRQAIDRATQSIAYLDGQVNKMRKQLQDSGTIETFSAMHNLQTLCTSIQSHQGVDRVAIDVTQSGSQAPHQLTGDATRFDQVMTILINNAVEATLETTRDPRPPVTVECKSTSRNLYITVIDHGIGIPPELQRSIFQPFTSTKQDGMGVGLFIARQIIQTHFKGELNLVRDTSATTFRVKIPLRVPGDDKQ